jgi:hypothetical protein
MISLLVVTSMLSSEFKAVKPSRIVFAGKKSGKTDGPVVAR